jgi:hypothetical protein
MQATHVHATHFVRTALACNIATPVPIYCNSVHGIPYACLPFGSYECQVWINMHAWCIYAIRVQRKESHRSPEDFRVFHERCLEKAELVSIRCKNRDIAVGCKFAQHFATVIAQGRYKLCWILQISERLAIRRFRRFWKLAAVGTIISGIVHVSCSCRLL